MDSAESMYDVVRVDLDSPEMAHVPADLTLEEREAIARHATEQRGYGLARGIDRGHFYQLTSDTIMLNHRPDYDLRHREGAKAFFNRMRETGAEEDPITEILVSSLGNLIVYLRDGWETGIYNEFRHFQGRGLTKAQLIELVLYGQHCYGIKPLQHVYNAVGKNLIDWLDGPRPYQRTERPGHWPKGWEADPQAFQAGLDLSVRPLTDQDRANVEEWYERNVGFLPGAVSFAIKHHPEFYKWQRARWEIIFQTLPKQVLPYMMVRQHMLTGFQETLREAVLLGKHWGVSKEWTMHALACSAYYTGFYGFEAVNQAVGSILDDWDA